jgi:pyridinium-3,5-biscarboxylic acid mononucleotide synthase
VIQHHVTVLAETYLRDPRHQFRPCSYRYAVECRLVKLHPEPSSTQQPDPQVTHGHVLLGEVFTRGQLGSFDQRQPVDGHRYPDRDPGGQAWSTRLVPHSQIPVCRQRAHHLFGSAHLGQRLAYPELSRCPQARAVRSSAVIEVGTGSDVSKPTPLGNTVYRGEHGPLTEVAAVPEVGPVTWVGLLVGVQHHQLRPDLFGKQPCPGQLSARKAGRVGDGGQDGFGAECPDCRSQHDGGIDPPGKGDHQAAQPPQPVEQRRGGGAQGKVRIRGVHGQRSLHALSVGGPHEIVGAVVPPAHHPASDPARDCIAGLAAGDRIGEVEDIARLDLDRRQRTAVPEVVFANGKTEEQTLRLLAAQRHNEPGFPALATRCPDGVLRRAASAFPTEPVMTDPVGRTVIVGALPPGRGFVAVLTGGTSDLPVAREAIATLQALGAGHRLIADIGVAGLHRLLAQIDHLSEADCVIAIAGMEGTLPGVVTGLIRAPVVGVPTSVGYGVSSGGQVAAATMLASCAPGLTVVNIDNGFGAAAHAVKIVARVHGG